jgi:flagellar M-ring protein FliF
MDFLNHAYAQVADLFRSMTPGARLTAGLLLIVVVVSVGYLFTNQISGPSADLMHGLPVSANALPAMEAAFAKANLKGYEVRGTQIYVPRGQEATYMAALAEAKALPPDFGSALRDAINTGNVFDSAKQREERIKIAIQAELGLIISSMSGIERAYVMYDVDNRPGFNKTKIITATASVKPLGSEQLDEAKVSSIRHLVAGAIAGLKPENVTVTDLNGRSWYGDPDNGGGAEDNLYVSLKRTYEQDLKAKILNALSFIPNVTVEPTVTLDTKKKSRTRELKHDPKALVIHQMDQSTTRSQNSGRPAGRPGYVAQQPNTPQDLSASSGGSTEEEEESKSEATSLASGQETETEIVGLTPKLAKVSVGIPISYFKKVWQQRNPAEEGKEQKKPDQAALDQIRTEESSKIQKHVAQLLPPADGVNDPTELVTVTTFQDIPGEEIPAPSPVQIILAWLSEYWSVLGMIAVVFVSLAMLRSLVRSAPVPAAAAPVTRTMPRVVSMPLREEAAPEPVATSAPARHFTVGPSLRDELSRMVKEDPDTAANILRSWIGSPT